MTSDRIDEIMRLADEYASAVDEADSSDDWQDERAALRAALVAQRDAVLEAAIAACWKAWPRAHTYASENADEYRQQDIVRDRCIDAIRALKDHP